MSSGEDSTSTALDRMTGRPAWAVIRLRDSPHVLVLEGRPHAVRRLSDVPLASDASGLQFDRLVAIPFRQVTERGFEAHDDGAPLTVIDLDHVEELTLAETLAMLPDEEITFDDAGGFDVDDAAYAEVVRRIIDDEIGNGEGANLVIGRQYRAKVADWGPAKALTAFRRLLERERGAYWTFCVFTGERYLVGASPERHVSVSGGDVRMNPISGTFRLRGHDDPVERKQALLEFLADEKEIFELFMVVDEELKMMCDVCTEGGQVLGPFLKPMSHLVHTEYLLAGRTSRDVRDVLRDTMFAATVTGSPVENACRLIKKYERQGRGYYGAALALLGHDASGRQTADSPIVIRTADIGLDGSLTVTAGATLVRDSDPDYEVAETHAKAGGILTAFGLVPPSSAKAEGVEELTRDEDVRIALASRNQRLSKFWLTDQGGARPAAELEGKTAVILDGEDDFVNMLRHVLRVLGVTSSVVKHPDYVPGCLEGCDLVIVGPGPGDPRDGDNAKIATFRAAVESLLESGQPFLSVCLGHQVLCDRLGIPLAYKDIVFQGTQSAVSIDGTRYNVGFYNTFVGRVGAGVELPSGVSADADPDSGDIHLLRGPHFRGIQFHAESILTEEGYELLRGLILELLAAR